MGKRSDFGRRIADKYYTPELAVILWQLALPSTEYPQPGETWMEPCAGDGAIITALRYAPGRLIYSADILPESLWIAKADALRDPLPPVDWIITNPPWTREILHQMIHRFRRHARQGTWLLFDANWAFTKQAKPYLIFCHRIVSVGRHRWFPGTKHVSKDDAAWYLFRSTPAPYGGPILTNGG